VRIRSLVLAVAAAALGVSRPVAQTTPSVPASPDALFDGAQAHDGVVVGPRGAAAAADGAAAADPDGLDSKQRALLDGLLAHVDVNPGPDPRAPALLHDTFVRIVRTRTGQEMAARFLAENARAVVEFGVHLSSAVAIVNGKAVVLYSGADTDLTRRPPVVMMNQGYLDADPAWRGPTMAGILGHELFGHALECQRADGAGVTESEKHYRGDEANAGMLGWLIGLEAGAPADDGNMWSYLRDPEAYYRDLQTMMGYYSVTFSVADMKDPLGVLKERRARVGQARARLHASRDDEDTWRPIVAHFVDVHRMESRNFSGILEHIDRFDAYTDTQDKEFGHIEESIDSYSRRLSDPKELAELSRESDSPYYVGTEQRLQVLRGRLKALTATRKPEPSAPPPPGQITWDRLSEMYEKDKKEHPEHWPK
jgi:hypothetical protein